MIFIWVSQNKGVNSFPSKGSKFINSTKSKEKYDG